MENMLSNGNPEVVTECVCACVCVLYRSPYGNDVSHQSCCLYTGRSERRL